jgi:hypothetical protein
MKFLVNSKLIISIIIASMSNITFGQGFSPYYTNTTYQKYLSYLIYSGRLKVNHPLSQPYGNEQLIDSLKKDISLPQNGSVQRSMKNESTISYHNPKSWLLLLRHDIVKRDIRNQFVDSSRGRLLFGLDVADKNNYRTKINSNFLSGSSFISYIYKDLGLFTNLRVDEEFRMDSIYFGTKGKLENKVISRPDESYLQWGNKNISIFVGRINRNFGIPGEPSLVLSSEAFSFDHFAFTFRNKQLKYSYIFSRINDLYGFDIRDTVPKYQWSKRFLTIHRFEFSVSQQIEIAFTDVILFGGKDGFPQFQYLNPANFLYISKMSDRKSYEETNANALMAFDLFFKPSDKLTIFAQFLIDDVDFTKTLRAIYPDRLGYSGKIIYADLMPESQFYISYNRISNWTYTSFYTWGNYTFYGKSLGYPLNGVENIKLGFDSFKFYPFMLSFEIKAEQFRTQDLSKPFIAIKTGFPIGTPQKSIALKLNTMYSPNSLISVNLAMEYLTFRNYGFVEDQKRQFLNIFLTLKMQGIFRLF